MSRSNLQHLGGACKKAGAWRASTWCTRVSRRRPTCGSNVRDGLRGSTGVDGVGAATSALPAAHGQRSRAAHWRRPPPSLTLATRVPPPATRTPLGRCPPPSRIRRRCPCCRCRRCAAARCHL